MANSLQVHYASPLAYDPISSSLNNSQQNASQLLNHAWEKERHCEQFHLHLISHNMPGAIGTPEQTARWNNSEDTKFQSIVARCTINIVNIIPAFLSQSEQNTAGGIVQSKTFAKITKELQTLFDSLKTSTTCEHQKVSLAEFFLFLACSTVEICTSL
jgi:hypothetical protein